MDPGVECAFVELLRSISVKLGLIHSYDVARGFADPQRSPDRCDFAETLRDSGCINRTDFTHEPKLSVLFHRCEYASRLNCRGLSNRREFRHGAAPNANLSPG